MVRAFFKGFCKPKFFVLAFLIFPSFAFAQNGFKFSFDAGLSFRGDTVREYVYKPNGDVLSRLDWNAKFVPTVDIAARFDIFSAIMDARLALGIPIKFGSMQDYDWISTTQKKGYDSFSTHDLIMQKFFDVGASAGYEFKLPYVTLLPQAGIFYRNIKFEAYGGYGQYAGTAGEAVNSATPKVNFTGTILTYEFDVFAPTISLNATCTAFKEIGIEFSVFASVYPTLSFRAVDNHYTRNIEFMDSGKGGSGFLLGTSFAYKHLGIGFYWEHFMIREGATYTAGIGKDSYLAKMDTTPGIESSMWTLGIKYTF